MTTFTHLPYEIIASILGQLDNVRFLLPCLLSCKHIHESYLAYPTIKQQIIRQQLNNSSLLPYAIAIFKASQLPYKPTGEAIRELVTTILDRPDELVDEYSTIPFANLLEMGRLQHAIDVFAEDFAIKAWDLLRKDDPSLPIDVDLSPKEHSRFSRALYRIQLFMNLFPNIYSIEEMRLGVDNDENVRWFFETHSMWDNSQLACVSEYLEGKFYEGSSILIIRSLAFSIHF